MKKLIIPLATSVLFLLACTQNNTETKVITQNERKVKLITKAFSDPVQQDTFRVELKGSKPKEMALVFDIISFKGKKIYTQTLTASALIENYKKTVDLKKDASQLKFMEDEFNLFLDEENFLEPAITAEEKADENTIDKAFYNELQKSDLNGFRFRLGKDKLLYIGWSDKAQQVKVYYKCC